MKKILMFIDDDVGYMMILERVVKKIASVNEVISAANGRDAIDKLKQRVAEGLPVPEVMFIDINMPVMDGFEFYEAFKVLREDFPVLKSICPIAMLTSSTDEGDKKHANEAGIGSFIVKPHRLAEIRDMIIAHLEMHNEQVV